MKYIYFLKEKLEGSILQGMKEKKGL